MHHTTIITPALALLSMVSMTSAFVLPANLADGNYQVRGSATGAEVHASLSQPRLRRSTTTLSSLENHLAKRDSWGKTWCECSSELKHDDTDAAVADLKQQVTADGVFIEPALAYYSVRGGVVAFVCNLDHDSYLHAWTDLVTEAIEQISSTCGQYVTGSQGGLYDFGIGYMANSEGLDFCGVALGSEEHACPN
ncbi:hypothetical protein J1614_000001 [Plenodomus biglobosus]|nr:hypothetical protein J1614_000001 [Plenodomus biglobosus]